MRRSPALPFLAALFACASAASAQPSTPLVPQTGRPLEYRIGLPRGWKIQRQDLTASREAQLQVGTATSTVRVEVQAEALSAESETGYVHLVVADMLPVKQPSMPVSWAEQRRMVTNDLIDSDSLLFGLLANAMQRQARQRQGTEFRVGGREIRTLGGQRWAYMNALLVQPGLQSQTETYVTVKGGIMYILTFADERSRFAGQESLFARVRDSLVFAENAPVSP